MAIERNPHLDGEGDGPPLTGGRTTTTESPAEAQARLEEIHQYLPDQYARREIVTSTVTGGGTMLDWVPVESQLDDGGSSAQSVTAYGTSGNSGGLRSQADVVHWFGEVVDDGNDPATWSSHPNCYTLEDHFPSGDASWGAYCWWGGSGRNSSCP
ncbi:hypothetical protein ACFVGY_12815 [Streptomyces sp. NPDC127106]|uniref:hypothetical protein n=1 Tax=Streptomyces sp. NPDC127106 TaxID=3345360 RepID=UPI0036259F32